MCSSDLIGWDLIINASDKDVPWHPETDRLWLNINFGGAAQDERGAGAFSWSKRVEVFWGTVTTHDEH